MSISASLASSSCPVIPMEPQLRQLLKACKKGDFSLCIDLIDAKPDILLSTTPHKNNCLHIAAMLGHHEFAREVWSRAPSLFSGTNIDDVIPLIAALMAANYSLASDIITAATMFMQHDDLEEGRLLNCMLLKVDRRGESVLHHAMRNGFENLVLQLLDIEPRLSEQVSNSVESPMFMAARRGYYEVVARLLEIPSSVDCGPIDESAMHTAVTFDHPGIVKKLLEGRPQLAYHKDKDGNNPLHRAVLDNKLELVKIFLEHDPNLAYIQNEQVGNITPFILAIEKGYLSIAEEIRSTCPDSVYTSNQTGKNALHYAIFFEKQHLIDYILGTPQLHMFINQADKNGDLPLHAVAHKCDPKVLCSLLEHAGQDYIAVNRYKSDAVSIVYGQTALWKTLKWNESFTLLSKVIPSAWNYQIIDKTKQMIKHQPIDEVKSLSKKYISNTSLVAALLATITFAAAFTLPGGFSSDSSDAGQPFLQGKQLSRCSSSLIL